MKRNQATPLSDSQQTRLLSNRPNSTAWVGISLLVVALLGGCAQMPNIGLPGLGSAAPSSGGPANTTGAPEDVRFSQTDRGAMITSSDRVLFDTGSSTIKTEGAAFIDSLVSAAKRNDSRLLIEGHTDNVGNEAYNRDLSERRADAVKQALIGGGVPSERITTVGFGSTKPVAGNDDEAGRSTNRRTEVILLGEKLENINRDDFMANLGRKVSGFIAGLTERFQYKPNIQNFDANDRMRSIGSVTRCGERAGAAYLVVDGSAIEPNTLRQGEQAILTLSMQLCVPEGQQRNVTQTLRLLRGKTVVISGANYSFSGMTRSRNNLFSRITVIPSMRPGSYEVETVLRLEGRDYRQTTPFTVQ